MNMLTNAIPSHQMSSLEIAELTGKEHRNVMRDIRTMLVELNGEMGVLSFEQTYINPQNNQSYPCYALPKRETLILVSGYSIAMRAKIIDRWQELEIQSPRTRLEIAHMLVEAETRCVEVEAKLAIVAPKAQILDRIASGKNMLCLQDAAKHLHVSCKHLINTLANNKWIYRRATSSPHRKGSWTAYEPLTRKGCLYHDYAEANGEMRAQVLITEKGLIEAAKLLGVTA